MKPYIMRNGGWVTPKFDTILEKAIFIDQWVNLYPVIFPRHIAYQGLRYPNILPCVPPCPQLTLQPPDLFRILIVGNTLQCKGETENVK